MPIPGSASPLETLTSSRAVSVREPLLVASQAWLGETYDLAAASLGTALTSQSIHASAIALQAGQVVNNVLLANGLAASGTLPTSVVVGLATADGKVAVKSSADLTQLASWPAGVISFALSAAYTAPYTGTYYVFILSNGTFGTNVPIVSRSALGAQVTAGHSLYGVFGTGQTTIPAVGASLGTFAATTGPYFWYAVN